MDLNVVISGDLRENGTQTAILLTPTSVKTANYTAVAGDLVVMDATSGALVVTLPTTPAVGTIIGVKRNDTVTANTVTVNTGAGNYFNISGGSTAQTIPFSNYAITLQYFNTVWYQISNALPIGQLDTRYDARYDARYRALASKRVVGTLTTATPTPNADTTDQYVLTALAVAAVFAAPSGTPTDAQDLIIRIKDDGTARALSWNAIYRAVGVTLPTTTVVGKVLYLGMKYNSAESKWDVLAVGQLA